MRKVTVKVDEEDKCVFFTISNGPGPVIRGMVELDADGRHMVTCQLHGTTRRPEIKRFSQYDWPKEVDDAVFHLERS